MFSGCFVTETWLVSGNGLDRLRNWKAVQYCTRFEVFTAVRMMMMFWVLAPHRLVFSPKDGDSMFLRNVGIYRQVYMAPKPRRTLSSTLYSY
jgi:hypothetical protein